MVLASFIFFGSGIEFCDEIRINIDWGLDYLISFHLKIKNDKLTTFWLVGFALEIAGFVGWLWELRVHNEDHQTRLPELSK